MAAWLVVGVGLALVTALASLTNGALGAGGAIVFVPLALYGLPLTGVRLDPHAITSLSLVQGICAFAAGGVVFGRRGQVALPQLWLSGPPLGIGALAGGALSAAAPGWLLVLLYALVVTAAAVLLFVPPGPERARGRGSQVAATAIFLGVGAVGGAIGVGAGVLVIPVLLYLLGASPSVATGTGLVLPVFISGPAFLGKAVSGQVPWALVPVVAVVAVLGVLAGARAHAALRARAKLLGLAGLTTVLAVAVWARLLLPS